MSWTLALFVRLRRAEVLRLRCPEGFPIGRLYVAIGGEHVGCVAPPIRPTPDLPRHDLGEVR